MVDSPHRTTYVPRGFVLRSDTQVLPGKRFFAFPLATGACQARFLVTGRPL